MKETMDQRNKRINGSSNGLRKRKKQWGINERKKQWEDQMNGKIGNNGRIKMYERNNGRIIKQ